MNDQGNERRTIFTVYFLDEDQRIFRYVNVSDHGVYDYEVWYIYNENGKVLSIEIHTTSYQEWI